MKILHILILLILCTTTGCSWIGYVKPNEGDFTPVGAYSIGIQNFDAADDRDSKRLAAVKRAIADVREVFQTADFENILHGQTLRTSCNDGYTVTWEEVVKDLRSLELKVSIYPKKPVCATGLTDTANNRIAIAPSRIDLHEKDEIIDASLLIETIAHEFTHMVKASNKGKYLDRGVGKNKCSFDNLVSYRVGKAAQAVWISKQVNTIAK